MTTTETTYKNTKIQVLGFTYSITVATGKFNYVNIRKITANPFLISGKDFANFDEAVKHYKSPEMKVALLKIELGF